MSPRPSHQIAKKIAKNKNQKQSVLHVAVVQMKSTPKLNANLEILKQAIDELRGKPCDLICLPENAFFLKIGVDEKVLGATLKEPYWTELSQRLPHGSVLLVGSVAVQKGRRCTNASVMLKAGDRPRVVYEKIHLFDVSVRGEPTQRESANFARGQMPALIKIKGWSIGLSICYDIRFSYLYEYYARKKVDLMLVPAAFLQPTGVAHWEVLLRARAIESQCFVVAAAQSGGHQNAEGQVRNTHGHSLVVGPWGDVRLDMGRTQSAYQLACVELSNADIVQTREQIPMSEHRRSFFK